MTQLEDRVIRAASCTKEEEQLIREYKPFILKCASSCAKRYVLDTDDEWSIALQAFSEAISKYRSEEGSFLSFAKLVIRRRLFDYFDANKKYYNEISVSPSIFSGEADEEEVTDVLLSVKESLAVERDSSATDEIEAANGLFADYGFSFFDLTDCSPKAEKTKLACKKAVCYLLNSSGLLAELHTTKQLPNKIVVQNTGVPRKILERHRKYIIAVVLLLEGDYPYLCDYLKDYREELQR